MWNDKPDGYLIPDRNPMSTGINFYPWVRVQISIHSLFTDGWVIALPDLNPTRCHPYLESRAGGSMVLVGDFIKEARIVGLLTEIS
jgi:hypothetical protein